MGAAASTHRRATYSTLSDYYYRGIDNSSVPPRATSLKNDDTAIQAKTSPPAEHQLKLDAPGGHTSENVPPNDESSSTVAAMGFNGARPGVQSLTSASTVSFDSLQGAASAGLSDAADRRLNNDFQELQEEVHRKRTIGMTYVQIFNQLATEAGTAGIKRGGKGKPQRRATEDHRLRHEKLPALKIPRGPPQAKSFHSDECIEESAPVGVGDNAAGVTTTTTSGDQTLPKSIAAREVDRELSDEKPTQQRETNEQSSGDTTEVFPTEENVPLPREAEELPPALSLDPQISSGNSDDEKEREAPKVDIQRNSESKLDPSEDTLTQTVDPDQDLNCVFQDRNGESDDDQDVPFRGSVDPSPAVLDPYGDDQSCPPPDEPKLAGKPLRRAQIFDKGVDASRMQDFLNDETEGEAGIQGGGLDKTGATGQHHLMGAEATDIVIGSLKEFFFLDTDAEEERRGEGGLQTSGLSTGMTMLMRAMQPETFEAGVMLMEQGEEGHHMFVVEDGSLEVIIDDEAVRVIGIGDRVGELALLCNAPRSASVRTLSPCVLWSIHREVFKSVQALTASANLITRSTHLYHVPWLRLLGTKELSKLAASFRTVHYRDDDIILQQGEATDRCFLVESGEVLCSCYHVDAGQLEEAETTGLTDEGKSDEKRRTPTETCEQVERLMMVSRPAKRTSTSPRVTSAKRPSSASARPSTDRRSLVWDEGCREHNSEGRRPGSRQSQPLLSRQQGRLNMVGVNGMGALFSDCQPHWDTSRGEVRFGKGCFLGVPVLLASAELEIDEIFGWPLADPRPPDTKKATESTAPSFKALSPVKIVARGDVKIGHFDVARFTKTVGPFAKVLGTIGDQSPLKCIQRKKSQSRQSLLASPGGGLALKYEKLSVDSFERMGFLGQGSFGYVTMVCKKDKAMEGTCFALKSLSKQAVVEGGQVQHIKDEKAVLELFNHPFVLRLYTTFQDDNRVYFLTELLQGGELWSIIYEAASGFDSGLPPEHVQFYGAIVVESLAYMHKKGIAYRDLKPENLIVDDVGYLRIIDMGFAKQIPFFVTVDGQPQMHPRSHTMCGTPEYLAPEFIFNKGHDQSADLWALGVLIFELVEARTPFAPPGVEQDIAQLFTNIACVKKRGVQFPTGFDERAGGSECRDIISGMLAFEPSDRLGNLADGMDDLKRHPHYQRLDWERLVAKKVPGPWIPKPGGSPSPEPEEIPGADDVYTGGQDYFADF